MQRVLVLFAEICPLQRHVQQPKHNEGEENYFLTTVKGTKMSLHAVK